MEHQVHKPYILYKPVAQAEHKLVITSMLHLSITLQHSDSITNILPRDSSTTD